MNNLADKPTSEEREQALQAFHIRQEKLLRTGRRMVFTIALANAGLQALQLVMPNDRVSLLALAAGLLLSITLLLGGRGVRYVFGTYAALVTWQVMAVMYYVNTRPAYGTDEVVTVALVHVIWLVVLVLALFFSKPAAEYMYMKQSQ